MRFFNTAGPVDCQRHYCLPPLERLNLAHVAYVVDPGLIKQDLNGAIRLAKRQ